MARTVTSGSGPLLAARTLAMTSSSRAGEKTESFVLGLDLADLGGEVGPLVDELEDLQVEFVDLDAEGLQVFRGRRRSRPNRFCGSCPGSRRGGEDQSVNVFQCIDVQKRRQSSRTVIDFSG